MDSREEVKGRRRNGGWITFPFIAGNMMGLGMVWNGVNSNLIVYLIEEYNVKSIDATQIANVVNGCTNLLPIAGAIVADSYFGCFSVVCFSTLASMVGMMLLTLSATIHSLRPPPCDQASPMCQPPSSNQNALLYTAIALLALGVGGTRFNTVTMGANQFRQPKDRDMFFNWFFFAMYVGFIAGSTAIVFLDNVSWGCGLGICCAANAVSFALFLIGRPYYRRVEASGSPFTSLLRVVLAAIRKRNVVESSDDEAYYYGGSTAAKPLPSPPTSSFRFLNLAAIKEEGDLDENGSVSKPWRICTVEQVEDLKALMRIFPLWSTATFLSTPIAIQTNLTVLQALSMDRRLGPHFKIPAGSFLTFVLLAAAISLFLLDRVLYPAWHRFTSRHATPLQRIGVGHLLNITGMVGFALVEVRRLAVVRSLHLQDRPNAVAPSSALWLIPPLVLIGVGEAFHFPGQTALYYQEFPTPLRSTSAAVIALQIGIGFYLSTAIIDLVRRVTSWLPNNINNGRLDNVYWMLAIVGFFNFGYFLVCAKLYRYQNAPKAETDASASSV